MKQHLRYHPRTISYWYMQFHHLNGNFGHVTKEYETNLTFDEIIQRYGVRVISQYTASKWMGSSTPFERIQSRNVAVATFGDFKTVFNIVAE